MCVYKCCVYIIQSGLKIVKIKCVIRIKKTDIVCSNIIRETVFIRDTLADPSFWMQKSSCEWMHEIIFVKLLECKMDKGPVWFTLNVYCDEFCALACLTLINYAWGFVQLIRNILYTHIIAFTVCDNNKNLTSNLEVFGSMSSKE